MIEENIVVIAYGVGVKMNEITIVTSLDNEYAQHCLVMLTSLAIHSKSHKEKIKVYVIAPELDKTNQNILKKQSEKLDIKLQLLTFDSTITENFFVSHHLSVATYYRIFIPELLGDEIKKAIYLDSDIVVKDDIAKLWEFDIGEQILGAVHDFAGAYRQKELEIPDEYSYFNAGVLLINLEAWRKSNLTSKLIRFIKRNPEKLKFHDQDALNALLYNTVQYLPYRWNVQTPIFQQQIDDSDLQQAIKSPAIIHYTTASKPWHITNTHYYKEEYYKYLKLTPFKDFRPLKEETERLIFTKEYLFIFGAGIIGEKLQKELQKELDFSIVAFIDNDSEKWGKVINNTIISSPEYLLQFSKENVGVIIASVHHKEIAKQLSSMGFKENEHFVAQM